MLAKMACDHFAKKNERGIAVLDRETLAERLWPLPVRALFGVGRRLAHHLERMGIGYHRPFGPNPWYGRLKSAGASMDSGCG